MDKPTIQALVWQAADQLFTEGSRPTVANVREITKRGSAGTINEALKGWWHHLSRQIAATEKRPDLPEPIVAAMLQLWDAALTQANTTLLSQQEEAARQVQRAQALQEEAVIAKEQAEQRCVTLQSQTRELTAAQTKLQGELAAESALRRLAESQIQLARDEVKTISEDAQASLSRMEKQLRLEDERYKSMERNLVAQADENKVMRKQLEKRLAELQATWQSKEASSRLAMEEIREAHARQLERGAILQQRLLDSDAELKLNAQNMQALINENMRLKRVERGSLNAARSDTSRLKRRRF